VILILDNGYLRYARRVMALRVSAQCDSRRTIVTAAARMVPTEFVQAEISPREAAG
jgi:hypothetical protein